MDGSAKQDAAVDERRGGVPRWLYVVILGVLVYPTYVWQRYHNVNESGRLYLVEAVVEDHVLHIDGQIERYEDLHDKATAGGHYYCDKAVGLSFLALPVYFVMHLVGGWFGHVWSLEAMRYLLAVVCVTVPTILLLCVMGRYWRIERGEKYCAPSAVLISFGLVAYVLGTPAGVYAIQFMGHQLAAVLLFLHFVLSRRFDRETCARRLLWAGVLTGAGAMMDFTSGVLHAVIVMSYLFRMRWDGRVVILICGGVIGFAPQLVYNALCFGGPLQFAYGHEALQEFQTLHGTGFLGVTFPRWASFVGLLFEGRKGLFFLSPFLALGFVGLIAGVFDRDRRRDAVLMLVLVFVGMWLAMSVHDWLAGLTVGPRHMISILPFLMTGVLWAAARWRWLCVVFVGLALVGVAMMLLTMLSMPAYEVNFGNPITGQVLFLIGGLHVAPNLGLAVGLPTLVSLLMPLVMLAGVLIYLLIRSRPARPSSILIAAAISAAYAICVLGYDPDPPSKTAAFRGAVLRRTDHLADARSHLESTLQRWPDVPTAGQVVPELLKIYAEEDDRAAAERAVKKWLEIDPANERARGLLGVISQGRL